MTDPSAYWSTVAQLCPVFGLGVVLEARRLLRRWTEKDAADRIVQAVFLLASGVGTLSVLAEALNTLASPQPSLDGAASANLQLLLVALFLTVAPLADIALRGNMDWFLRALFAVTHPVLWAGAIRSARRLRRRGSRVTARALDNVENLERYLDSLQRRLDTMPDDVAAKARADPEISDAIGQMEKAREDALDLMVEAVELFESGLADHDAFRARQSEMLEKALGAAVKRLQEAQRGAE